MFALFIILIIANSLDAFECPGSGDNIVFGEALPKKFVVKQSLSVWHKRARVFAVDEKGEIPDDDDSALVTFERQWFV